MSTSDRVKKIVQEEGRTARNLVLYHVPVQSNQQAAGKSTLIIDHKFISYLLCKYSCVLSYCSFNMKSLILM